jgi:hypothetical protein
MPIVLQLQADALDPAISITDLLRKAKVVATKLDQADMREWVEGELTGINGRVPEYRMLHGRVMARNPYHGWQPVGFASEEESTWLSQRPCGQSIAGLQQLLANGKGDLHWTFPPDVEASLMRRMEVRLPVTLVIDRSQIAAIIDAVRNTVLDWSLKLEAAGIVGEGLTFSQNDKRMASTVTQTFIAQNIGHIGDTKDKATVTISQNARLDMAAVSSVMQQIKQALPMLPANLQDLVRQEAATVEAELAKPNPDQGIVRGALLSMKTVTEGAVGNLAASGIGTIIGALLGG